MWKITTVIIVILLLLICAWIYFTNIEGFRGSRGIRHNRGYSQRTHHYNPRRNYGWGNSIIYTVPIATTYGYNYGYGNGLSWYDYMRWYNPWYYFTSKCKDGCTKLGNGNWGCQYPGATQDSCIFASDCNGCAV